MTTATTTRPATAAIAPYAARHTPSAVMLDVPLAWLTPNVFNPRRHFAEEALDELAASLTAHGMLEPIVAREAAGTVTPCYEIIAGERRWRAATRAGLETVPVRLLTGIDDATALQLCIVENLHRADLDPIEEALGYEALRDHAGMKQPAIAAAVKRSQPSIARSLGLLKLPDNVQDLVRAGTLSVSHAEALLPYAPWPDLLHALVEVARDQGWTSKQLAQKPFTDWRIYQREPPVARRYHQDVPFIETCRACPFGAYRRGELNDSYCLQPAHYDELAAAAKAAATARIAAQHAQVGEAGAAVEAAGGVVLDLRTLAHGLAVDLESFSSEFMPPDCTAACPCRAPGLDRWGNNTAVCTDPERFERLKKAHQRATTHARNTQIRAQLDHAQARLATVEAAPTSANREIALIAQAAIERWVRQSARDTVATRWGLAALPTRDEMAGMDAAAVIRLAADVLLSSCALEAIAESYRDTALLDWYLGPPDADGENLPGVTKNEEGI